MTTASLEMTEGPQMVVGVPYPTGGDALLGVLVVDRVVGGTCVGGIRARAGTTTPEVTALAREMTLKCAFWEKRAGGAKAGILAPLPVPGPDRHALFTHFGRQLAPLLRGRLYWTGTDMGTTPDDVRAVYEGAGIGVPAEERTPAGYYSSLSVALTCQVIATWHGESLAGKRVIIDGLGKLGEICARLLQARGCEIVGISTAEGAVSAPGGLDTARLTELRQEHGDRLVKHIARGTPCTQEALLTAEADILIPCAGPFTFHEGNIGAVRARWVVPGANLATRPGDERLWSQRGIAYCPGYVANAGEVFVPHVRHQVRAETAVEETFSRLYRQRVQALLERARDERTDIATAALRMSKETLGRWSREEGAESANIGTARSFARRIHRKLGEYL